MTRPADDDQTLLTQISTTLWGAYGTNGLNSDVKRHGEQIGELFGRDEALRNDLNTKMSDFEERVNGKLDGLYKLIATLIVSILVGAGAIVASVLVTS